MKNPIKLYQREGCPYCQIVRKKLSLLELPVLLVPVPQNSEERDELFELSGVRTVPVLVDQDKVIAESQDILKYLDETYGNGVSEQMPSNDYGIRTEIEGHFEEIVEKTTAALKNQGFGVLTDINIKKTLKAKLDVDVPQQVILGACNPKFAYGALEAEADLGLLLPCNVVVREKEPGKVFVTAVNPLKLLSVAGRDDLLPVAKEVKSKLSSAISSLAV
jgi:uncharacterized protein (DUF302 family)/glutaredoxin